MRTLFVSFIPLIGESRAIMLFSNFTLSEVLENVVESHQTECIDVVCEPFSVGIPIFPL